ncbi:hypothetical protein HPB49_011087 [Dermacentor silvarum]|uniref:Uncharacterized protein n=1 Tax=Dermacentor silvarum TaxID=543639 RepID=A0ACB8DZB8_DERSI|nr:hypothetical protein HPB49_011087 [Dermacentor silvarum]
MSEFERHGGLIIDEIKLTENFAIERGSGKIDGFVDLGPFTPETSKIVACDHGMVVMFQPLSGSWHQILGVFVSRGNVKTLLLSKVIVEATLLAENAGLGVGYVTLTVHPGIVLLGANLVFQELQLPLSHQLYTQLRMTSTSFFLPTFCTL